jgi:hypothetical protein
LLLAAACAFAACAGAAELGSLFYTAEERERLDRMRRGEPVATAVPGRGADSPVAPRKPGELTGFVKRSDGRGTAFIDGVPVPVDKRAAEVLDPKAVHAGRGEPAIRIERRP